MERFFKELNERAAFTGFIIGGGFLLQKYKAPQVIKTNSFSAHIIYYEKGAAGFDK